MISKISISFHYTKKKHACISHESKKSKTPDPDRKDWLRLGELTFQASQRIPAMATLMCGNPRWGFGLRPSLVLFSQRCPILTERGEPIDHHSVRPNPIMEVFGKIYSEKNHDFLGAGLAHVISCRKRVEGVAGEPRSKRVQFFSNVAVRLYSFLLTLNRCPAPCAQRNYV